MSYGDHVIARMLTGRVNQPRESTRFSFSDMKCIKVAAKAQLTTTSAIRAR